MGDSRGVADAGACRWRRYCVEAVIHFHPFVDGNTRRVLLARAALLHLAGYASAAPRAEIMMRAGGSGGTPHRCRDPLPVLRDQCEAQGLGMVVGGTIGVVGTRLGAA